MKKYRISLEFPEVVEERLERLQALSHSASKTEVIRRALSLFDVVLSHQEDTGGKGRVVLRYPDGESETLRVL